MSEYFSGPVKIAVWLDSSIRGYKSYTVTDGNYTALGYTRVSDYVEVQFTERPVEDLVPEQLANLDKKEQEVRERFQEALNEINARRADIMQLPFIQAAKTTINPLDDVIPF